MVEPAGIERTSFLIGQIRGFVSFAGNKKRFAQR